MSTIHFVCRLGRLNVKSKNSRCHRSRQVYRHHPRVSFRPTTFSYGLSRDLQPSQLTPSSSSAGKCAVPRHSSSIAQTTPAATPCTRIANPIVIGPSAEPQPFVNAPISDSSPPRSVSVEGPKKGGRGSTLPRAKSSEGERERHGEQTRRQEDPFLFKRRVSKTAVVDRSGHGRP